MHKTEQLMDYLKNNTNINDFFNKFKKDFHNKKQIEVLEDLLMEKNLTKTDIVNQTQLSRSYIYKIFGGEKIPTRDKLLQICFAMKLDLNETDELLRLFAHSSLYPKVKRDGIIIFAINKQMTTFEVNDLLCENHEKPLFQLN